MNILRSPWVKFINLLAEWQSTMRRRKCEETRSGIPLMRTKTVGFKEKNQPYGMRFKGLIADVNKHSSVEQQLRQLFPKSQSCRLFGRRGKEESTWNGWVFFNWRCDLLKAVAELTGKERKNCSGIQVVEMEIHPRKSILATKAVNRTRLRSKRFKIKRKVTGPVKPIKLRTLILPPNFSDNFSESRLYRSFVGFHDD